MLHSSLQILKGHGLQTRMAGTGTPHPSDDRIEWLHHWPEPDNHMSLGRTSGHYLFRFRHIAEVLIEENGNLLSIWPRTGASESRLEHVLLDQLLPRLLDLKGKVVLHAGALRCGEGTALLIGPSGAGKSTLTAALCQSGCELLSDDAVVLGNDEGVDIATPTYHSLRLLPATLSEVFQGSRSLPSLLPGGDKRLIDPADGGFAVAGSGAVRGVFFLATENPGTPPAIENIGASAATMQLIGNAFRFNPADLGGAANLLDWATAFALRQPCYHLKMTHAFRELPVLVQMIRDQMARIQSNPALAGTRT